MHPNVLPAGQLAGDVPGPLLVSVRGALSVIDPPSTTVGALKTVAPGVEVQAYAGNADSDSKASAAASERETLTMRVRTFLSVFPAIRVISPFCLRNLYSA
jgi:hypothetical protein